MVMKMLLIVVALAGLAACNDGSGSGSAAPSTKRVDSAVAAAPDTIKAMAVDSGVRRGRGDTVR